MSSVGLQRDTPQCDNIDTEVSLHGIKHSGHPGEHDDLVAAHCAHHQFIVVVKEEGEG